MRALVVFAHYFRAESQSIHSSTDERARAARRHAIAQALLSWRAHFGETATLNVEHRKFELNAPSAPQLDLAIVVNRDDHLLDDAMLRAFGAEKIVFDLDQPRMLPFMAQRIMADRKQSYDWFVYSEDDLAMRDGGLFSKLDAFRDAFGPKRVLQPHRYEINPRALRAKTYIDGDLRPRLMSRLFALVEESEPTLIQRGAPEAVKFTRAMNPHSGFFALCAEQFDAWSRQPHFLDLDSSFVSPLESAATLGLMKTFSVYKPALPMRYLEIEHLDAKFSSHQFPVLLRGELSAV